MSTEEKRSNKGTMAVVAGVVGALAVGGAMLATNTGDEIPVEVVIVPEEQKPLEAEIADTHILTKSGKKVRVVGAKRKANAAVEANELGHTVEAEAFTENSLCNVILTGETTTAKKLYGESWEGRNRDLPNLPALKTLFGKASWPVKIGGSCNGKICFWNALFKGQDCATVATETGYVGSSLQEILDLPMSVKKRVLKIQGTCEYTNEEIYYEGEGEDRVQKTRTVTIEQDCFVPLDDPRSKEDGEIILPHGWAGRHKLNFTKGKGDKAKRRYKDSDFRSE